MDKFSSVTTCTMLAWGDNSIGCTLGLGKEITSPALVPDCVASEVKILAAADHQCCILSKDGCVYSFDTKNDELPEKNISSLRVSALETLNIVDIFAGGEHMFAVSDKGHAYGWGMNKCGQLGRKNVTDCEIVSVPKKIPRLPDSKKVVQISCGQQHTLVLLNNGAVYAMGDNSYGQLGIGNRLASIEPTEIFSLCGLPIAQVVAGGWHSFCVTVSGRVFCWGKNDFGQLGLGDREDREAPCLLKMLDSRPVKFVDAGDGHTAVLTKDGGVFTFGSSDKGQLGHNVISEFEVNPKKVAELMGSVVSQVACGKKHTLAFVPGCGQIFAFGSGMFGQLGQGCKIDCHKVPTIVKGPWKVKSGPSCNVEQIVACGNQSFVIVSSNLEKPCMDFRNVQPHRRICTFGSIFGNKMSIVGVDGQVSDDTTMQLECVLNSQSCINSSFLADDHHKTNIKYCGLNLGEARSFFSEIMRCKDKVLLQKIESYLQQFLLDPSLMQTPPDVEALRLYVALPELALFHSPDNYKSLVYPFVRKILSLPERFSEILDRWYGSLEPEFFVTTVQMCQKSIIATVKSGQFGIYVQEVVHVLNLMQKLNKINDALDTAVVDFRKFHMPELNGFLHLDYDYKVWSANPKGSFSFCRYPFVLDAKAKTTLLWIDSHLQMNKASQIVGAQNFAAHFFRTFQVLEGPETRIRDKVNEVCIRRDHLVPDAINKVNAIENLKLPFRVRFDGEAGLDYGNDGGLRKEFFMLILGELFDPKYGMFSANEYSQILWFSDHEDRHDKLYNLIGILCGLAVYNSDIIDVNFPLGLYKKLLGKQLTLSDLKEFDPVVGSSMQQLLDYVEEDDDTIQDTFGLTFAISCEVFGKRKEIELIEDGGDIPVTSQNRNEYVHHYIDYMFNRSVESQYKNFSEGFLKVCGGEALKLFRPEELMEMFVGNQNYDWEELEKTTQYGHGFSTKHQVIIWFWEVFHSMKLDEKKEFIRFLTGSSKIPIGGLKLAIRPLLNLDREQSSLPVPQESVDDYLPVARACFCILDLPVYTSKEALEVKLKLSMKTKGFYLV